ncbi:MAG TPA: type II toxin-antitoxin system HipA family toxin [Solirubrobacteraceae bacterium]|jgi:serine/threonine-protein kinase HipA|nr:type II toxin-antitoxin system HipA family toxin [Solirubrobacteraceae bacterium]
MNTLGVWWGRKQVGVLEQIAERSREYSFRYASDASRAISLALPLRQEPFGVFASRAFFEALLPEGPLRERIAAQIRVAASDSFGLLAELGRDCAGALQILEGTRMSEPAAVEWLDDEQLDDLITGLPRHPLGIQGNDQRMRLSLAGVQNKAVLVRDDSGRFGRPLNGMPSTHILKPEPAEEVYPGLASNEFFCMQLAARCALPTANVEMRSIGAMPCLIVERYDRLRSTWPPARVHQEDLCQALGIPPEFKYQHHDQRLPSYRGLAELLDAHSALPGIDRLTAAYSAVFHFLVGNADAHAKNVSLVHDADGVRLAPLYDIVSTAAYPELSGELALAIGDEFAPGAIGPAQWSDLAEDFGLNPSQFARARRQLVEAISREARGLRDEALAGGWHHSCVDAILETIAARAPQAGP